MNYKNDENNFNKNDFILSSCLLFLMWLIEEMIRRGVGERIGSGGGGGGGE